MSVNIFDKSTGSIAQIAGNATGSGGGTTVTVDNILSTTSENPVQNKVITEELNKKADQTTVDSALSLKANSADVTASLAGKSDTGHTHDDRYYTESEINTLLDDKVSTSDFNSHTNNTTVHVTAEEKAAWNAKAEMTDIPDKLPADGGNADTLDGLHETSFSRNRDNISDCNNAVLPGTYNALPGTGNMPYSDYWLVTVDIGASGTWIRQTATRCNTTVPTETYHRLFVNDAWNSWTKINGNADIAKKVETASQKALLWEDSEGGNLHLESPDGNHSVEMDLYNNSFRMVFADNGELAFPVDYNSTTKKFNINGNADTVDGKHASDFALKTDIPTTLPANGGRSDTTSHQINHYLGQGIDVLTYAASDNCPYNVNTKVRIMHSPTCPTNYGYDSANNDFWYDIYKLDNSWVTIKAYDIRGNVEFINSCLNGTWSGWIRCNDNGNATSANYAGSVSTTLSNNCLRNISAGTTDLSAGVSELATGAIYLVYE